MELEKWKEENVNSENLLGSSLSAWLMIFGAALQPSQQGILPLKLTFRIQ